jgi:integrase
MANIKLTKYIVEKIPYTESGQIFYRDSELKGFGLRVGTSTKTFFCEKKIAGKAERVTVGTFPTLTVETARRMAQETIIKMMNGESISQNRQDARLKSVTLSEVYDSFKSSRDLKSKTLQGYDEVMRNSYGDWRDIQVSLITKDMVEARHSLLSTTRGKPFANRSARTLRSILNFAMGKYELSNGEPLLNENPFVRISKTKQWHRIARRTGHLKPNEFPLLFAELEKVSNPIVSDFIKFVLFTGCRRQEASSLMWSNVNAGNNSFVISDSKNHNPLELPLTSYLLELMTRRRAAKVNDFVFPAKSKSGHIEEPKKTVIAIGEAIEHHFTIHDLRRTYVTVAESLDISHYALKALVNHKANGSDVTSGYIQLSVDRLREPMQRITDFILKNAYNL